MRSRNKPSSTFIERTESAILHERELSIKRGYEVGLIRGRKEMIEKACEWFGNYLMDIGYPDDWMRDSKVQSSGEQRFRKAMEE